MYFINIINNTNNMMFSDMDEYIDDIIKISSECTNLSRMAKMMNISICIFTHYMITSLLYNGLKDAINKFIENDRNYNDELDKMHESFVGKEDIGCQIMRFLITTVREKVSFVDLNKEDDVIIDEYNTFKLFEHQLITIQKIIDQGFRSGVVNMIMGAGKSYIILKTISEHFRIKSENKIYILYTRRTDILSSLFFNSDKSLNRDKFEEWKTKNLIDIDKFNVYESLFTKKVPKFNLTEKPAIYIVNEDYLKIIYHLIKLSDIALIINDECHSVNAYKNYGMLSQFRSNGI